MTMAMGKLKSFMKGCVLYLYVSIGKYLSFNKIAQVITIKIIYSQET